MATSRPPAVVMSASAIPAETEAIPPPDVAMPSKARMMPMTVPNRPTNGAVLFRLRDGDHGRAVHALAGRFDGQLGIDGALVTARGLELEQTGRDDFSQMALLVLLGHLDGLAVLTAGEQVRKRAEELERLVLRLLKDDEALDHDPERVDGHEEHDHCD